MTVPNPRHLIEAYLRLRWAWCQANPAGVEPSSPMPRLPRRSDRDRAIVDELCVLPPGYSWIRLEEPAMGRGASFGAVIERQRDGREVVVTVLQARSPGRTGERLELTAEELRLMFAGGIVDELRPPAERRQIIAVHPDLLAVEPGGAR